MSAQWSASRSLRRSGPTAPVRGHLRRLLLLGRGARDGRDGTRARHPRLLDRLRRGELQPPDPAALHDHRDVVGSGRVDPAMGSRSSPATSAPWRLRFRRPAGGSAGRLGDAGALRRRGLLLRARWPGRRTRSRRSSARSRPTGSVRTSCFRTTRSSPSTRRFSISASSASRSRSPSPSHPSSPEGSARPGSSMTRRWTLARMGVSDRRDPPRGLVVVPGARLGRLLGLGPGGERLASALALRHRLPALVDRPGTARV